MYQVLLSPKVTMPKGKKIAQIAHASVNLLLERFQRSGDTLITTDPVVIDWVNHWANTGFQISLSTLDLHALESGFYDSHGTTTQVIDLGRTVFNGHHTLTAIGYSPLKLPTYKHHYIEPDLTDEVRQVFLLNEQNGFFQHGNEELIMPALAVASIMRYATYSPERITIKVTPEMLEWLSGGHPKIVLKNKTAGQFNRLAQDLYMIPELPAMIVSDEVYGIYGAILGPHRRSKMDLITRRFRLL